MKHVWAKGATDGAILGRERAERSAQPSVEPTARAEPHVRATTYLFVGDIANLRFIQNNVARALNQWAAIFIDPELLEWTPSTVSVAGTSPVN